MNTARLPRPLLILYAGTIVTRLGTFVVPYLTLYLSGARGMSLAATGRVIAAGSVGMLLGNLAGGWLADRVGRKPTLIAALALNMLGVAALARSWDAGPVYALALALALGGAGMYTPAAAAVIADLTSEAARPRAYTVNYVCINVGVGLGPLLGGLLVASSYAMLFIGDIVSSAICALLILVGLRVGARPPATITVADTGPRRSAPIWRVWLADPGLLWFCGASALIVAPLMGLEYAVPLLVGRVFAEPLVLVGVVYTINAAGILSLSFPIERAIRGRDPAAMMMVAGLLWTTGLLILWRGFSVPALLGSTLVWTVGEIIASIVVPTTIAARAAEHTRGRMLALQDVVRSVGGIGCPIALGLIWDGAGVEMVLVCLLALPGLGALVYAIRWLR